MRSQITLEVLEILDAIDRRGSFAKAAEELNRVTSALSYSVQKLEEQLDIVVFRRQGRRSVLTPAGKLLLDEGRQLLQASNDIVLKAKEVANGWEPRIRIAVESLQNYPNFFAVLSGFLQEHPSMEIDIRESVLNGGWDALARAEVELLVGAPGPVPSNQGIRVEPYGLDALIELISSSHPLAEQAANADLVDQVYPSLRRVVLHDTSVVDVARSAGLGQQSQRFYVQTMEQKYQAIKAGIGIGFVPTHRAERAIESGELIKIAKPIMDKQQHYLAWKVSNKGKGLQELCRRLLLEGSAA